MMYGPQAAFITEQFPSRVRYAGSSLAYTLAGVVCRGLRASDLCRNIQGLRHNDPSFTVCGGGWLSVTLIVLWFARETAKAPLAN